MGISSPNSKKTTLFILALLCLGAIAFQSCTKPKTLNVEEKLLTDGWQIIAAADAGANGNSISSPEQNTDSWINAKVPTTVLAALVEAGVHPDPFYADNLDKISPEPFQQPWWFRKTFAVEDFNAENESLRLFIDGITYRANIWLNGIQIASQDTLYGSFRQFSIDITKIAMPNNVLAFEIFPPKPGDFYMGFVDWAPMPPDKYMGIYREVRLKRTGKVTLDRPFVKTDVNTETLSEASLSVNAVLTNTTSAEKTVAVSGIIENIKISKDVTLAPNTTESISFTPGEFADLNISNPRLWWPNGLGKPEMYALRLQVHEKGVLQDEQNVNFGIRKVETYLNESQVRGYKVNGREVLIKSGGWVDDLFLRYMPEKDAAQIRYVKEMNMNSIRLEGFWGNNHHLYDLCDQNGILVMVGFSCQWEWPDYLGLELKVAEGDENLSIAEGTEIYGVKITEEEENLLSNYFRDQVLWLRNHPSIFCWAVGSDAMPKPSLEQKYQATLDKYDVTRSLLVSAGQFESTLSGPSGMKMNGPYEYVPPVYWFEDQKLGGAFGFNSETGPGPQIPPVSSIKKMMPEESWWPPMNPMWDYHSGRKEFNSVDVYMKAMDNKYGAAKNLDELGLKAQLMNYEAMRPMFEAFVVDRPKATGVVQWMLNSPWPEFYWQLYDYYLMPTGAYFGTLKACQPATLIYNYYDNKVYASNDATASTENYTASIRVFDINSNMVFEKTEPVTLGSDEVKSLLDLPKLKGDREVYFLDMKLADASGAEVSNNFYWLATKKDELDWKQFFWYYTPQKQYADFTKVNTMGKTDITASKEIVHQGDEWEVKVTLTNASEKLAFFMELMAVKKSDGSSILPVFWSDNYISLTPDESKIVTLKFYAKELGTDELQINIQGVNLKEKKTI